MTWTRRLKTKVCLVGEQSVGKTSLVRRFVKDEFDDRYITTLGVKASKKEITLRFPGRGELQFHLLIWDFMGQEGFRDLLKDAYFDGARGILAVADVTRRSTLEALGPWIETVRSVAGNIPSSWRQTSPISAARLPIRTKSCRGSPRRTVRRSSGRRPRPGPMWRRRSGGSRRPWPSDTRTSPERPIPGTIGLYVAPSVCILRFDAGPDHLGEDPCTVERERDRSARTDRGRDRRPALHARDARHGADPLRRDRDGGGVGPIEDRRDPRSLGAASDARDREDAPDDPRVLPSTRDPAVPRRRGPWDRPSADRGAGIRPTGGPRDRQRQPYEHGRGAGGLRCRDRGHGHRGRDGDGTVVAPGPGDASRRDPRKSLPSNGGEGRHPQSDRDDGGRWRSLCRGGIHRPHGQSVPDERAVRTLQHDDGDGRQGRHDRVGRGDERIPRPRGSPVPRNPLGGRCDVREVHRVRRDRDGPAGRVSLESRESQAR